MLHKSSKLDPLYGTVGKMGQNPYLFAYVLEQIAVSFPWSNAAVQISGLANGLSAIS